jgi:hypothetical protein
MFLPRICVLRCNDTGRFLRDFWRFERAVQLIRADGVPGGVLAVHSVEAGHRISLDHLAAEGEHVARMGAEFDVMDVYEAFDSAGLMRAFEMSGKLIAELLDLHVLCGTAGLVNVLRVYCPVS